MKVIVANCAGACYGVNRALKKLDAAVFHGAKVRTLGPLIHNPRLVAKLESRGILVADSPEDAEPGETLVIRSHGVAPEVIEGAEARGLIVEDATCPHVAQAHKAAAELGAEGRLVIVVGELGHPEVDGICAHVRGGNVIVVPTPQDLPEDLPERIGVVVQTTQSRAALEAVVDELERRGKDVKVYDTICNATRNRQDAARELAQSVDCVVVIGGRNSGNTRRLAEICSEVCPNTHHIETASEIDPAWFAGCETVGVTAGASTPQEQIDEVVSFLMELE